MGYIRPQNQHKIEKKEDKITLLKEYIQHYENTLGEQGPKGLDLPPIMIPSEMAVSGVNESFRL